MHVKRPCQRVDSLMLDLRMNGVGKRRTLFHAKGFAFQETASKHPKSPKHLRGIFSSVFVWVPFGVYFATWRIVP